jgi:hypothetical protein
MQFSFVSSKVRSLLTLFTLAVVFTFGASVASPQTLERAFGDVQILATVPFPPGFPEGIAVNGDKHRTQRPLKRACPRYRNWLDQRRKLIPSNFTVLDVFVNDKESLLVRPSIP